MREAEDIEFIHRMRVASRRIRSCLPLFEECFSKKYREWRKEIRNITRVLREARDADVQIAFLKTYIEKLKEESLRPGAERFLLRLRQRRERTQPRVIKAMDRLLESGVVENMERSCRRMRKGCSVDVNSPVTYQNALVHIISRLEEIFVHEASVYIPENIEEHHAMRIAVKRLRYTMEVFSPLYEEELENQIAVCKKLQDLLGDMHDYDVWMDYLPQFVEEERAYSLDYFGDDDSFRILEPGLLHLQQYLRERRSAIYEEFVDCWKDVQEQNIWNNLKQFVQLTFEEKCKNQVNTK